MADHTRQSTRGADGLYPSGLGGHPARARDAGLAAEGTGSLPRRFMLGFAGAFAVWLLLVGTLAPAELVAGAIVALLTSWLSLPRLALLDGLRISLALPWHVLRFLAVFLVALVESNIDMARRVLAPELPIRPAIVEVATGLRSRLGRLLLANSITLTPGTLTVDVLEDRLCVHWIDITPGADLEQATRAIVTRFEDRLSAFLQ